MRIAFGTKGERGKACLEKLVEEGKHSIIVIEDPKTPEQERIKN